MPEDHQPKRSRGETIFLAALVSVTLLLAVGFTVATVGWAYGFPSTMVAFLISAFLGTLVYTFLGGVEGAEFKAGATKLGGTAAVVLVVFYVVEGPLDRSMRDARAIQVGMTAEARIDAEISKASEARRLQKQAEQRVRDLEAQSGESEATSVSAILGRIENSTAGDRLGKGVLGLYRDGKGPFDRTLRTLKVPVRFNHAVPAGTFWHCSDRQSEMQGKPVRFEIVNRAAGTSEAITLRSGSEIGAGICSEIEFDVMLGCDAVEALLKTVAMRCDSSNGVAWIEPSSNKIYELTATILNPELTPGS